MGSIYYPLPHLVTYLGCYIQTKLDSPGWRPVVLVTGLKDFEILPSLKKHQHCSCIYARTVWIRQEHSPSTPLSLGCIPLLLPNVQVKLPLISMATLSDLHTSTISLVLVYGRCMSRQMAGLEYICSCFAWLKLINETTAIRPVV